MARKATIIALVLSWLVAGCAATGESYTPASLRDSQNALIYFYRLESDTGELVDVPLVYVNDAKIAALRPKGYTVVEVPAGKTTLALSEGAIGGIRTQDLRLQELIAEAGSTYYFSVSRETRPSIIQNAVDIYASLRQQKNQARAKYYLKNMRLQPASIEVAPPLDASGR